MSLSAGPDSSLDIVRLITRQTGLNFKPSTPLSWPEGLKNLANKKCDVLPWATETEPRKQTMNFTTPYARIVRVVVTRHAQPFIPDIIHHIDKVFVVEFNNAVIEQLREKYPGIKLVHTAHTSDSLDMVIDGNAFASIANLYSVSHLFNNRSIKSLKIAGSLPSAFDDIVSLSTRKEDAILHSILQKSIQTIDPRAINNFLSQGATLKFETGFDYQLLWQISGAATLVLVIFFWWNRRLSALNEKLAKAHSELAIKSMELEALSITDPLTKIFNRLKMDQVLITELNRAERYRRPLSIIMIDLDHFKRINDNYGHIIGDLVLFRAAQELRNNLRHNDLLGRWGGEEFLVICPEADSNEATTVAEKLRNSLKSTRFDQVKQVTASFGLTTWQPGDTQQQIITRADNALYEAKRLGRDRVVFQKTND
ncbi:transporter substrate-binding domain-containing diguanylate cyclase [Aliikangiella coralliicola]|uniref:transporter substrate-binding domain-containing diguanylate cyclase n=1 Tax=Aliikangiella coralliicola TaxID=2592383 RepID=UPI00143D2D09|nr:diguanylate cyclase [Aliikangiella coralliicola]